MKLHIIIASTRPGRVGKTVADWFTNQVPDDIGLEVEVVDLAEVGLPLLDEPNHPAEHVYVHEHTRRWSASVAAADAFVLVMPEYNVGFTAPLKNALDYLYTEWNHKPVGFVSYGMTSAGLRAVEMLKPVLISLQMVPIHSAVSIPLRLRLDAEGVLHPDEVMAGAAQDLLSELRVMSKALATVRAAAEVEAAAFDAAELAAALEGELETAATR